jgi:hypothetical protein
VPPEKCYEEAFSSGGNDRFFPSAVLGNAISDFVQFERSPLDPGVLVFRVCDLSWVVDPGGTDLALVATPFLNAAAYVAVVYMFLLVKRRLAGIPG